MSQQHVSTLGRIVARRAELSGHLDAFRAWDGTASFADLEDRVRHLAACLWHTGVRKGDRVGILMQNGLGFAETFFAIVRLGAIACPLNTRLSPAELNVICDDSGLLVLMHDGSFQRVAAELKAAKPEIDCVELYKLRQMLPPAGLELDEATASDVALLIYTSGTTGRPKGVVFTHEQLLWSSLTMVPTLDVRPCDVHLLPVPMFHVGGLSFIIHCVQLGVTLIVLPRWDAEAAFACIEREGVAHFFAVPIMLAELIEVAARSPSGLKSLRWIMGGGAPVPAGLIRKYDEFGVPLLQTCGATETGGPGLVIDPLHAVEKAGSVGRGFFHTQVRLVSEDGDLCATGQSGEIQMMGRHLTSGYWNAPQLTAELFSRDGWLRTGDIGVSDEDGFIWLIDRKRNKIITGGENVYPAEVEAVLRNLPAISDVAVVGLPDPRWGEIVTAVLVCRPGHVCPTIEELRQACEGLIAGYKHPRRLIIRDDLPRNATGKLLREPLLASLETEDVAG